MRVKGAVSAVFALVAVGFVLTAVDARGADEPAVSADVGQVSLVEDYQHPNKEGAAAIGLTLKHGNGKIFWVDCAIGADLVTVESDSITTPSHVACFKVVGIDGYLALEIPSTYFVKAGSHKLTATLTGRVNGQDIKRDYSIKPGQLTPVGEPVYPDEGPAALVELRSVA
ncbi:hypothetical protein [Amycolatopsis sp. lyj-112]|uniref:hypothetical protein n=1 Tax=Amycolatopsis sp. lyj-112 TaxID=2789288 RepID=UPI0039792513